MRHLTHGTVAFIDALPPGRREESLPPALRTGAELAVPPG
jgi:hypothetical protein